MICNRCDDCKIKRVFYIRACYCTLLRFVLYYNIVKDFFMLSERNKCIFYW